MVSANRRAVGHRAGAARALGLPIVDGKSIRRCQKVGGLATDNCWLEGVKADVSVQDITVNGDTATINLEVLDTMRRSSDETRVDGRVVAVPGPHGRRSPGYLHVPRLEGGHFRWRN